MFNDLIRHFGLADNPIFTGGIFLMILGAIAAYLRRIPGYGIAWARRRMIVSLEVHDRDQSFAWFQKWLAQHQDVSKARDLVVSTQWNHPTLANSGGPIPNNAKPKLIVTPSPGIHWTRWHGRPMMIYRMRREAVDRSATTFSESIVLRLWGGDRSMLDELIAEVSAISEEKVEGVRVMIARGDSWAFSSVQPKRPKESLVLAGDIVDDIVGDIKTFQSSAQWYADRGVPYRRGFLFHGVPGSGKTTLAGVLAGELNLSIAAVSLGSSSVTDETLRSLLDNLPSDSLMLIEDVDAVFESRIGTAIKAGVTLEGLLNAIDGVGCRDGRILILTTNYPDRLDPALVRPGRVDRRVEFGYATREMIAAMFRWFYKGHAVGIARLEVLSEKYAGTVLEGSKITPARVQEHLLRYRDDPETAFFQADVNGLCIEHKDNDPEKASGVDSEASATVNGWNQPPMPENGQASSATAMLEQQIREMKKMGV